MSETLPIISVITATYSHFEKIYKTIDSVFAQDYINIEYIISDDGSEHFPKIDIENYINLHKPQNIECQIIHHTSNIGTVKNLNKAYKISKGKYIINLSCGDVFFQNNVISTIIYRFLDWKCDVLVTSRILYKDDFKPICFLPHYSERNIILRYSSGIEQYKALITSKFYDMASGSAMYFSRDIIEKIGYFDENYYLWEDGPFLAKYLLIGNLSFAYDIISIWYETGGVSSSSVDKASPKMQKDIEWFIKNEKMAHFNLLNIREKRLTQYRNSRFLLRNSYLRYILYLIYFPEFISFMIYSRKRKKRIKEDEDRIQEQLNRKDMYNASN